MTEPSQVSANAGSDVDAEGARFVPFSMEEMFGEPERKPGRMSAADRAAREELLQRRHANYQAFLANYAERGRKIGTLNAENERLVGNSRYWEKLYRTAYAEREELTKQITTNITHTDWAWKVLAQLDFLMSDTEARPFINLGWSGTTFTLGFTNKYGKFELIFGDKLQISVTPADTTRPEQTFDLDNEGVIPHTVLLIQAHVGLPQDGQLPERAAKVLRKKEDPATARKAKLARAMGAAGLAGLVGMAGLDVHIVDCGEPNCPVCSKLRPRRPGLFSGMDWPRS